MVELVVAVIVGAIVSDVIKGVQASSLQDDQQAHEIELANLDAAQTAREDADTRADEAAQREWDARENAANRVLERDIAAFENNPANNYRTV